MSGQTALSRDAQRRLHRKQAEEGLARRRARIEAAREFVRPFAGDHVDVMAVSYMLLLEEKGQGNVTPAMVNARARSSYPEAGI